MTTYNCSSCFDCGLIANDDDHTPWVEVLKLPLGSAAAVVMGLIRPIPCLKCAPRRGDLIETECLKCKARDVGHPAHKNGGGHWIVIDVFAENGGKLKVHAVETDTMGAPAILEYTGRNIKIIKRYEERTADILMGDA